MKTWDDITDPSSRRQAHGTATCWDRSSSPNDLCLRTWTTRTPMLPCVACSITVASVAQEACARARGRGVRVTAAPASARDSRTRLVTCTHHRRPPWMSKQCRRCPLARDGKRMLSLACATATKLILLSYPFPSAQVDR